MEDNLKTAMAQAGFNLSDEMPTIQGGSTNDSPEQANNPVEGIVTETNAQNTESGANTPSPDTGASTNFSDVNPDLDIDSEVLNYLSEKLGTKVSDYDYLSQVISNKPAKIDERVAAINEFVMKTGRSPEDWYKYQQLNPAEMDDITAIRNQMVIEYDNLSMDEINLLVNNKYKLDADRYDDNEVAFAKLQLKMDAESARKVISGLRDGYQLPVNERGETEVQSPITEEWVQNMTAEVNDFDGLIFQLPSGENFTYGIKDDYRRSLISKNSRIEEYFDDYVNEGGSWNFEKLNAHRAVVDNIDSIVQSVYQQGLSDGQRKVVQNAANISNEPARRDSSPQSNSLDEQILKAFGGGNSLSFNF
jgi:hypothetical protein